MLWESADIDDLISKKAPPDFSSGDAFLAIKIEKKTKFMVRLRLWCGCSSLLHWVTKCDVLFKLHLQQALHTTAGGWPHFREEVRTMRFTFTFHVGRKTITLGLVVKSKNRHPGR